MCHGTKTHHTGKTVRFKGERHKDAIPYKRERNIRYSAEVENYKLNN